MKDLRPEINLLPPGAREQRVSRVYLRRVGVLLRVAIRMTVMVAVVLLVQAFTYRYSEYVLETNEPQSVQNGEEVRREVAARNATIALSQKWLMEYQPWTPLLREFFGAIPGNISLSSLKLDSAAGGLVLTGAVTSRADIVNFEQQIEELEWVDHVDAPLSNFETGEAAMFTFTAVRK